MDVTNRKTISDIYETALIQGLEGFAAAGLQRLGEEFSCSGAEWQTIDTVDGKALAVRSQFVSTPAGRTALSSSGDSAGHLVIELQDDTSHATHRFSFAPSGKGDFPKTARNALTIYCEHLMAAESLARRVTLKIAAAQAAARGDANAGLALTDRDGNIRSTMPEFVAFMKRAQHGWDGEKLPFTFVWEPRLATHGMVWKTLFFRIENKGEYYQINVREDRRQPGISDREFEIAVRVGKGMTFKEIARALDLAPSTVSTHLYNLYAKLGISRRAHLVDWLNKSSQTRPEGAGTAASDLPRRRESDFG